MTKRKKAPVEAEEQVKAVEPEQVVEAQVEEPKPVKKVEKAKPKAPAFAVAAGVAITTLSGIKSDGDIVTEEILSGGIETMTELLGKKLVIQK